MSRNLPLFRKDIQSAIDWSEKQFGVSAADRYGALIRRAISDVLEDPMRPGAKSSPELARGAYVYHLIFSRDHVAGQRVKSPRHVILYRYADEIIEFARLLHDTRDLELHMPNAYRAI